MRWLLPVAAWLAISALTTPAAAQRSLADDLNERAKAEMMAEPAKALVLATEAERRTAAIADANKRRTTVATSLWLQSEALIRTREAKAAMPRITRALQLINSDPRPTKLHGDLLLARAGVEQAQTKPAEALVSLQQAFVTFGKVGEKRSQAIALQTMAVLYTDANDLVSADKYFRQAADIYGGDQQLQIFLLNNRANVLARMNRAPEAIILYRRALTIARRLQREQILSPILTNLARHLAAANRLDEAEAAIREAIAIARRAGQQPEPRLLATAAETAFRRSDLKRARSLIERAFAGRYVSQPQLALRDAHMSAYRIYSALNEPALALRHLDRVRIIGDDVSKLATTTSTALMAARFDYANQELRIANLKAEELRKAAEFQRTIFLGLGGATFVIIVLLSIGLLTIRRSRNQVRAANTELNQTNVALEKALKAKTEFLATTSHEIRTPLNGILGMTQIMLRDSAVPPATRDRLSIVHGAGMTMRALVDDILDVAKMETGNLTVELAPTDLHTMLREVTRMWEEQARGKGVGFKLELGDAPRWIETDAGRMRQMLFNLLSNAVKFTERGEVSVRAAASADRLTIAVMDTGIGIPADKHEEIFESFRQADSGTTRKFGGTGLGLAIVRNLAHALDGDVSVASVEGQGTTFTLDLPLKLVEAPAGAIASADSGETIVVLDKNPIARGMLRTLFAPKFAAVEFAATPDDAIERLAGEGTALLLAEEATLKAAGDDAFATLAELVGRAGDRARTAVLWARPDEAVMAALRDTGVGIIVAKPVAGPALIEALTVCDVEKRFQAGDGKLVSNAA